MRVGACARAAALDVQHQPAALRPAGRGRPAAGLRPVVDAGWQAAGDRQLRWFCPAVDAATGAFVREMHGAGAWIAHIACSPDGATIAAARVDGTAWVWTSRRAKTCSSWKRTLA